MQKVTWKQAPKKHRIQPIRTQKALKMGSQNQAKITKNLASDPHVPRVLPADPMVPQSVPQADKMVPKVVKWRQQASK